MKAKLHIKKDDIVKIIAGEHKGEQGRVLKVYPRDNTAIVESINIVKKHTKPNAKFTQGGIIDKEAPINLSNIMLVDASGNATRVGRKLNSDNKLVRYSKKTEEEIK